MNATYPSAKALLAELNYWLAASIQKFRSLRQPLAVVRTQVECDITADLVKSLQADGRSAHTAEQLNLEASRVLSEASADGLTAADRPAIERAARLIRTSASRVHDIADHLPN